MKKNLFNKSDLSKILHDNGFATTKVACETAVELIFDSMVLALKRGDKVAIPQLGIFQTKTKAKSEARNPKTGEKVVVPEHQKVKFSASKSLKDSIN